MSLSMTEKEFLEFTTGLNDDERNQIRKMITETPSRPNESRISYIKRLKSNLKKKALASALTTAPTPIPSATDTPMQSEEPEVGNSGIKLEYSYYVHDILEDNELAEKPYLFVNRATAANAMRSDIDTSNFRKSALWTLIFSMLSFIPTSTKYYSFDNNWSRVTDSMASNEDRILTFFQLPSPYTNQKTKEDPSYFTRYTYHIMKICFYGVMSVCKQVSDVNKSFMEKRWEAYKSSTGIIEPQGISPFVDPEMLMNIYKTMYNSPTWANLVRTMIIKGKDKIPSQKTGLTKLYDTCLMIMKDYGQKHLSMGEYIIRSKTYCLLFKEIQDELDLMYANKEDAVQFAPEGIPFEYLASIGKLPNNLQQSNFQNVIAAYMLLNSDTKYKNDAKPTIPISELRESISKKIESTTILTEQCVGFLNRHGISGNIVEEEFKQKADELLLKKLELRAKLERQKRHAAGEYSDDDEPTSRKRRK